MLIFTKNDDFSIWRSSTRGLGDAFKLIITNTSNLRSTELSLSVQDRTVRYDRFVITEEIVNELDNGWYDFVIVDDEWDGNYDTTTDIILNYPLAVIEIGKLKVREQSDTPIVEYITEKVEIKDYEPDRI